jgi:hypothetical protein
MPVLKTKIPRELAGQSQLRGCFLSISLSDTVGTDFGCLILETAKAITFPGNSR